MDNGTEVLRAGRTAHADQGEFPPAEREPPVGRRPVKRKQAHQVRPGKHLNDMEPAAFAEPFPPSAQPFMPAEYARIRRGLQQFVPGRGTRALKTQYSGCPGRRDGQLGRLVARADRQRHGRDSSCHRVLRRQGGHGLDPRPGWPVNRQYSASYCQEDIPLREQFLRPSAGPLAHGSAKVRVDKELGNSLCHGLRIAGGDKETCLPILDHLARAAHVGSHGGDAGGRVFDGGVRHRLRVAGEHCHLEQRHDTQRVEHGTEPSHLPLDAQFMGKLYHLGLIAGFLRADGQEPRPRVIVEHQGAARRKVP